MLPSDIWWLTSGAMADMIAGSIIIYSLRLEWKFVQN